MNSAAYDPLRVLRCPYCRERFGTSEALAIHNPKPADKRSRQLKLTGKVRRSLCASEKTMLRGGAWRGHGGVWWTVERETEDSPIHAPQGAEFKTVISDKIATLTTAIPEARKPRNGALFRKVPS